MMDRLYTFLICTLNRSFAGWHITGKTLMYFAVNNTLAGLELIEIAVSGPLHTFDSIAARNETPSTADGVYSIYPGVSVKLIQVDGVPETVKSFPIDYDRAEIRCPINMGAIMDAIDPDWPENVSRLPREEPKNCFFTASRKENGHKFIKAMYEHGAAAGIKDQMFLGFGNVLGYALRKDFLPMDDDIDMCINGDSITQEQAEDYLRRCRSAGLCEARQEGPVSINGKYVWFSIGPLSPYVQNGVKACNWFWFEHGGFAWHSKGSKWIGRAGLNDTHATAKGLPMKLWAGLKTVSFGGFEVQMPKNVGTILDFWYSGWINRKKESSAESIILTMPAGDKNQWDIQRR